MITKALMIKILPYLTGALAAILIGLVITVKIQANKNDNLRDDVAELRSDLNSCKQTNKRNSETLEAIKTRLRQNIEEKERQRLINIQIEEQREKERKEDEQRIAKLQSELSEVESTECSVAVVRPDFVRLYLQTIVDY